MGAFFIMNKKNVDPVKEHSFQAIFKYSPLSTQIFSPDGMTIMVNKAWEDLWKISRKQIINNYNILKDQQLVEKKIMPYIKKGFTGEIVDVPEVKYELEKTVPGLSKIEYKWVKAVIYPVKDKDGNILQIVLQHIDTTEIRSREEQLKEIQSLIKNTDEALQNSEAKFRRLFDANIIGIFTSDLDGKFLEANDLFLLLTGYTRKDLNEGKIHRDTLTPPEYQDLSKKAVDDLKGKGSSTTYEKEYIRKDGKRIPVLIAVTLLEDINTCIGFVIDITARKEHERLKDEFISMASHELKTPITSMKMFVDILQNHVLENKQQDIALKYIKRIHDQTDKMKDLVDDLLDVSRIETGKLQLKKEIFNIMEVLEDTIEAMKPAAKYHTLLFDSSNTLPVCGDKFRIYQVITNLLTNAIKYSPRGKKIVIAAKKDKNMVIVSVQDFGIGIAKSKQKKIFEKLYQVTDPVEMTYPGLGIGLYISKEIIQRHEGEIWVESEKNKGSTFYFTLPID